MSTARAFAVAVALGWSVAPVAARAQMTHDATTEVRRAVDRIFAGMHAARPEMIRAVFAADARFAVLDARSGPATIAAQSVDGWLDAVAGSGGRWNEVIYDVRIDVDGDVASVWAPYTFYLDGAVRHCGVDSIELLRDADGWKVTQLSDTRRTDGCPDPLGGRTPSAPRS